MDLEFYNPTTQDSQASLAILKRIWQIREERWSVTTGLRKRLIKILKIITASSRIPAVEGKAIRHRIDLNRQITNK